MVTRLLQSLQQTKHLFFLSFTGNPWFKCCLASYQVLVVACKTHYRIQCVDVVLIPMILEYHFDQKSPSSDYLLRQSPHLHSSVRDLLADCSASLILLYRVLYQTPYREILNFSAHVQSISLVALQQQLFLIFRILPQLAALSSSSTVQEGSTLTHALLFH